VLLVLAPSKTRGFFISDYGFSARIKFHGAPYSGHDISQVSVQRRDMPDLDLRVGRLAVADTIDEVSGVSVGRRFLG
jgi:hypothetical protein